MFWLCGVQRENKNSNKNPQSSPSYLAALSLNWMKHILSIWLLHLLLKDRDERNLGSILQIFWPEQLSRQREKCFNLLLVDTTMLLHEIYRIQSTWPMQHPHRQPQWENFYLSFLSQHCLNTSYRHCIEFWKRRLSLMLNKAAGFMSRSRQFHAAQWGQTVRWSSSHTWCLH